MHVFDHIFKTGGTSLNLSYLPGAFAAEELVIVHGFREPNRENLQRLMALPEDERRRIKVIAGHNTGRLRPCYPEAKFITLVRDPIDRGISGYLHAKYHPDAWEYAGEMIAQNEIGLAEFVQKDLFARRYADFVSLHDWQAKTVLGPQFTTQLDGEIATRIIRSRYRVVGYTEAVELFLFYLHLTEDFPLVLFNNRLVRQERATFQATAEDLAEIERHNQLDRMVYNAARMEFDRKVAQVWTSETEQLYRTYLEALEFYRSETQRNPDATPLRWPPQPVGQE